ncbi:MAG: hypothetical protein K2X93_15265 [Candidatus Obscuribacterales bacterium]|nr:hypothetical protein [Candidatus Obscuribacterales bacterium]
MIELNHDHLVFSFPEVHPSAKLTIEFQRTLRIPDDDKIYPLPPGLGNFPLRHVDDFSSKVPDEWIEHGGIMLPMYQSEALWLRFNPGHVQNRGDYPFAIRVLTGKIDAVNGQEYSSGLQRNPSQNYVVSPGQPWLDGYCIRKGLIRQFVAMPLGEGYTAEEQVTGSAEHGGLQLVVNPMKREAFEKHFPEKKPRANVDYEEDCNLPGRPRSTLMGQLLRQRDVMGLAPGGKMKQEIYRDRYDFLDWDHDTSSRCFVHIANSKVWHDVTGAAPPTMPPTAERYSRAGLPWFDYYDDSLSAIKSQEPLENLVSVDKMMQKTFGQALSGNKSCDPEVVVTYRTQQGKKDQVREGNF